MSQSIPPVLRAHPIGRRGVDVVRQDLRDPGVHSGLTCPKPKLPPDGGDLSELLRQAGIELSRLELHASP